MMIGMMIMMIVIMQKIAKASTPGFVTALFSPYLRIDVITAFCLQIKKIYFLLGMAAKTQIPESKRLSQLRYSLVSFRMSLGLKEVLMVKQIGKHKLENKKVNILILLFNRFSNINFVLLHK